MAGRTIRAAAVAAGAILLLSGCSSSEKSVSKGDVADQIIDKVNEQSGHKPDSVSCPQDLKAVVGTSLNCELIDNGHTYGVNVTVTSVDGSRVNYDIVETVNKDSVAGQIADQLSQQVGRKPDVSCPEDLKGDKGATLRCQLSDQGATYGITVTVTSEEGGDVQFDFKVDSQPQ